MIDPAKFALATLALLAAPGPTNTLLATSAASAGDLRSLRLVAATALGYVIATLAVALIVSPISSASRVLDIGMRLACGRYLMFAAWRTWREGDAANDGRPLQFHGVLLATSLSPKGIILATLLVPNLIPPSWAAAPYVAALAVIAVLAALIWVGFGVSLRTGALLDARLAHRTGAVVLAIFALLVAGSALIA